MIPQSILELQQYNVNLAKKLYRLGYKPLASVDSIPCYKYKNTDYDFNLCINYLEQSNNINTNLCIITDTFIVLDIDNPAEFMQLKKLAKKYNCTSNQVVKTKNGYHVYYAVDYAVKAQNNSNNKIAIKCNSMPNTAPNSYRASRQFIYQSLYSVIKTTELNIMPEPMFRELRPTPKIPPAPEPKTNPNFNYSKYNLPVIEYLSRLNTAHYLNGDRFVWLRVLAACKETGDPTAYQVCLNWSKQFTGVKMTDHKFASDWKSATGVRNGYRWLKSQANF